MTLPYPVHAPATPTLGIVNNDSYAQFKRNTNSRELYNARVTAQSKVEQTMWQPDQIANFDAHKKTRWLLACLSTMQLAFGGAAPGCFKIGWRQDAAVHSPALREIPLQSLPQRPNEKKSTTVIDGENRPASELARLFLILERLP